MIFYVLAAATTFGWLMLLRHRREMMSEYRQYGVLGKTRAGVPGSWFGLMVALPIISLLCVVTGVAFNRAETAKAREANISTECGGRGCADARPMVSVLIEWTPSTVEVRIGAATVEGGGSNAVSDPGECNGFDGASTLGSSPFQYGLGQANSIQLECDLTYNGLPIVVSYTVRGVVHDSESGFAFDLQSVGDACSLPAQGVDASYVPVDGERIMCGTDAFDGWTTIDGVDAEPNLLSLLVRP